MERRKVTFKLYPNASESERLTAWGRLHCERYNAALEERIDAYRKHGKLESASTGNPWRNGALGQWQGRDDDSRSRTASLR